MNALLLFLMFIAGIFWFFVHIDSLTRDESVPYKPGDASSYKSALENDMWKRKREKILNRDNHTCQHCGSHINLQVHHKYYMRYPDGKYADPWDYPDEKLITLCETCHKKWHGNHKTKTYYRKWGEHYDLNP